MSTTNPIPPSPSSPSSSPPAPLQQITLTEEDMKDPRSFLALLNNINQNQSQLINYILGHGGEPPYLKSGANFGGMPVKNVGAPSSPGDVVTQSFANSTYGAAALAPQFQALGKHVFQSYRRINDRQQRENYSSFLNGVLNTTPTANTATLSQGSSSGGAIPITVSSGFHQRLDGSQVPFASRTDNLTLPLNYALSSLTRVGATGIVTGITSGANTIAVGNGIGIGGAIPITWQGNFVVLTVSPPFTFTYFQPGPNDSTSGGEVSLLSTFYYTISKGQNQLGLVVSSGADTWSNRASASQDGSTIVAVVTLNYQSMDLINSAAGATAPQTGSSIPVVRRL
jgi:hypothetical protein